MLIKLHNKWVENLARLDGQKFLVLCGKFDTITNF